MRLIGKVGDFGTPLCLRPIGTTDPDVLNLAQKIFYHTLHPFGMVGTPREGLWKVVSLGRTTIGTQDQVVIVDEKGAFVP